MADPLVFVPGAWAIHAWKNRRTWTIDKSKRKVKVTVNREAVISCRDRNIAQVVIIGGGAAGHLAAISCARLARNHARVTLLESSSKLLDKVRQSGGGRCNVTSGIDLDDIRSFASNYPRGRQQMLSTLSNFGSQSVINFFEHEGVQLKTEPGGKVFPVSDSSSTIVNSLINAAKQAGVRILTRAQVVSVTLIENDVDSFPIYDVKTNRGPSHTADFVVMATGSSRLAWSYASSLGHRIIEPVPSLFTFGMTDSRLQGLAGVSVDDASIKLQVNGRLRRHITGLSQRGPILITHWGLSGPAVLSLSAFGARVMHEKGYKMECVVNWIPHYSLQEKQKMLRDARHSLALKQISVAYPFRANLPKRLWRAFVESLELNHGSINKNTTWGSVSNNVLDQISQLLHACCFQVLKKGQFKEEFVTAGGVALQDVDTKTFESKVTPQLFFAGETLDVDGRTGGYNLQFAWSSGFIAGNSIAEIILSRIANDVPN